MTETKHGIRSSELGVRVGVAHSATRKFFKGLLCALCVSVVIMALGCGAMPDPQAAHEPEPTIVIDDQPIDCNGDGVGCAVPEQSLMVGATLGVAHTKEAK